MRGSTFLISKKFPKFLFVLSEGYVQKDPQYIDHIWWVTPHLMHRVMGAGSNGAYITAFICGTICILPYTHLCRHTY